MKKLIAVALTSASLFGLAGCAGMDRGTATTVGGAALGGVVGEAVGGTTGALLGAGAGAYLGSEYADRQRRY